MYTLNYSIKFYVKNFIIEGKASERGRRKESEKLHCYEMHNFLSGVRFINGIKYGEWRRIKR
jgi:hypothetical protein